MSVAGREPIAIGRLTSEPIDPATVIAAVSRPGNGGTAVFIGTVRNAAGGRPVTGLEYSAYVGMAERELATIVREALAVGEGVDVAAVHRIGSLAVGDVAVAIAAGHAHRGPAFEACAYVIEQVKRRVPIWKAERFADGSTSWVGADVERGERARRADTMGSS